MNLVQFTDTDHQPRVGVVVDSSTVEAVTGVKSIYQLAQKAISNKSGIEQEILKLDRDERFSYQHLVDEKRLIAPAHHQDQSRLMVSGTGLTHLGSADTRAAMHKKLQAGEEELTDSMKMFNLGVKHGKPLPGESGVQPEWFYKGDGSIIVDPEHSVYAPAFTLDLGDEAEIAGIYIIGDDHRPYRLGFTLGNEFSDHITEKMNYLYLAHSKLRPCSLGPELVLGDLPDDVRGTSRIVRGGNVIWEKEFLSGESNMCHSIPNLESHHFKYQQFLRPGDLHVHFFGTSTLSFSDGIETMEGDMFDIECPLFGRPLRNTLKQAPAADAGASVL